MDAEHALLVIDGVVITTVLFLLVQHFLSRPRTTSVQPPTGVVDRDDDRCWVSGILYNNPVDPDLIVPKRFRLGWTVNVGHPLGRLLLIVMLLLPVATALLAALAGGPGHAYGCHPSGCYFGN